MLRSHIVPHFCRQNTESLRKQTPLANWSEKTKKAGQNQRRFEGVTELIGATGGWTLAAINHDTSDGFGRISTRGSEKGKNKQAIGCTLRGVGVEFDALPNLDFPRVKSEASETAGCRVGKPGFRVAVFCSSGRGGAACHL